MGVAKTWFTLLTIFISKAYGYNAWLCGVYILQWPFLAKVSRAFRCRADSRFAPSQWEAALLCNDVSHWLGANTESVPLCIQRELRNAPASRIIIHMAPIVQTSPQQSPASGKHHVKLRPYVKTISGVIDFHEIPSLLKRFECNSWTYYALWFSW